jgi:Flp pilus assembly pilin Flp
MNTNAASAREVFQKREHFCTLKARAEELNLFQTGLAGALAKELAFCGPKQKDGYYMSKIPHFLETLQRLWLDDTAQDIAEYAVMLAVILVIVVATVRLIGGKSNNVFSEVASSIG